jgi:hypothetical protein
MHIEWVGMTRQHYQTGRPGPIRAVVIHATAGRGPGDLGWLRKGGDERRPVSCHYYIDKAGRISQLVKDEDTAWHAGRSRWTIDGRVVENLNRFSVGIELENLNSGRDPYPEAQVAAAAALTRELVRRYDVPRSQLVRHLDISPGRKTDPAGFAWADFVARVYSEPLNADANHQARLRARMLDLAYRAAGAALPVGWPLFEAARRHELGMPVATITNETSVHGSAQDDRDRPIRLSGQPPLLVEAYARDLLYAPTVGPADEPAAPALARRLADTPPSALRDALLERLFSAADPVNGFQRDWAFHQYYLNHGDTLGVPIGPNHRITLGPHQTYVCQHFAFDSLCSPLGAWKTIYRLSELEGKQPGLDAAAATALRHALLDDLYRARHGRRYNPATLLARRSEARNLGAPLGRPEIITVGDDAYLLTPYARDVLACRLPALDWPLDQPIPADAAIVGLDELPETLLGRPPRVPRPLLRRLLQPRATLLGAPTAQPALLDLSPAARGRRRRPSPAPETVLIAATPGPAPVDLRDEATLARWHYYVDTAGAVYRLCDEIYLAGAAADDRAVVIAVEGDPAVAEPAQRAALSWLVRSLAAALSLAPESIQTLPVAKPAHHRDTESTEVPYITESNERKN